MPGEWEQFFPPSWGKQESDAYLWKQVSWSGTLNRATRPEFSPPLERGCAICPNVGSSRAHWRLLRAWKGCLCPLPHSGAGGLSSERGRRQRSRLGAPFTDGELRLGRRTEPSTQNTTNCYCYCWYLLDASCVQVWAEYAWSFENCEFLKEDGKSISLFMSL